jgi:hypothetical protein
VPTTAVVVATLGSGAADVPVAAVASGAVAFGSVAAVAGAAAAGGAAGDAEVLVAPNDGGIVPTDASTNPGACPVRVAAAVRSTGVPTVLTTTGGVGAVGGGTAAVAAGAAA